MIVYLKVFAVAGVYALGAWTAVRLHRQIVREASYDTKGGAALFV